MPSIEFYHLPISPPCRAVEMVAGLAGVTLNKHYVDLLKEEHLKEDYVKLNPLHRVPFIVDGDLKLNESRAIMAYLVDRYMPNGTSLYPKDPVERARIDEMLHFDLGFYSCAHSMLDSKLFGLTDELDPQYEKVFRDQLKFLDNKLKSNGDKFIVGDELTLADISMAATISFAIACDYDMSEFTSFCAYLERLETAIPNYSEINDEPIKKFRKLIQSNQ